MMRAMRPNRYSTAYGLKSTSNYTGYVANATDAANRATTATTAGDSSTAAATTAAAAAAAAAAASYAYTEIEEGEPNLFAAFGVFWGIHTAIILVAALLTVWAPQVK